jgi:hypothetical protein
MQPQTAEPQEDLLSDIGSLLNEYPPLDGDPA